MALSGKKKLTEWTVQQATNAAIDADVPPFPAPGISTWDGIGWFKVMSKLVAKKITVDGDDTYVAIAPIGTAQATAGWQARKIAISGNDTTITWADGDASFNNVATDLTLLSYS